MVRLKSSVPRPVNQDLIQAVLETCNMLGNVAAILGAKAGEVSNPALRRSLLSAAIDADRGREKLNRLISSSPEH